MNIKITGFGEATKAIVAQNIIKQYLTFSFWVSPLAIWKVCDIIKHYLAG